MSLMSKVVDNGCGTSCVFSDFYARVCLPAIEANLELPACITSLRALSQ
jgi:hypothetical protein